MIITFDSKKKKKKLLGVAEAIAVGSLITSVTNRLLYILGIQNMSTINCLNEEVDKVKPNMILFISNELDNILNR
jgi:hypothetical protein